MKKEEMFAAINDVDDIYVESAGKGKTMTPWKKMAAAAAVLVLVFGAVFGTGFIRKKDNVMTTIVLDINPSIEIRLNNDERVVEVKALNEDAAAVVGDMDFSGSTLDVALNAIIGSMLRSGYISEASNSVLVTVDGTKGNEDEVRGRIMEEIDTILAGSNISGAVLSQKLEHNDNIQQMADRYGISEGKAQLIEKIVSQNSFYKFDDLVGLTINELNLISESGSTKLETVDSVGNASDKDYVGEDKARKAAYAHAGVDESEVTFSKVELDWEDGHMVYEVDFDTNQYEFEYEINAKTGNVEKYEKEHNDDYIEEKQRVERQEESGDSQSTQVAGDYIGAARAKAIALEHAGFSADDVRELECELDHEKGKVIYEVEFKKGSYEYSYDIDAVSGDILKREKELDD